MNHVGQAKRATLAIPPPQFSAAAAEPASARTDVRSDCSDRADLVPTIFHEPWWLNSVSRGTYQEVQEIVAGRCVGRLPFVQSRHRGLTIIGMPTLTHVLGPAIDEGSGSPTTRAIRRIAITKALVERLPRHSCLWIKCHHDVVDTLGFQAHGFSTGAHFTSEISPGEESDLWLAMRDTARRVIRRASERLHVVELRDPDEFMAFYDRNLRMRDLTNNYDGNVCAATLAECLTRNVGRITVAIDEKRRMQAAIVTVWDRRSSYYLMTTRTQYADSGAISLLIWDAIKDASANGRILDLDGFSKNGDIQFLTRFGGRITPRYSIERASMKYRLVKKITQLR